MSDQPKPTTGEWTLVPRALHFNIMCGGIVIYEGVTSEKQGNALVDAHNSALAAGNQALDREPLLRAQLLHSEDALAAEREEFDAHLKFHQKLAAEQNRTKLAIDECDVVASPAELQARGIAEGLRIRRQRSYRNLAERRRARKARAALDSLRVALADHGHQWTEGERAIYEESIKTLWDMAEAHRQLQRQLAAEREKVQALVDAMEEVLPADYETDSDLTADEEILVAALAKVKEGK